MAVQPHRGFSEAIRLFILWGSVAVCIKLWDRYWRPRVLSYSVLWLLKRMFKPLMPGTQQVSRVNLFFSPGLSLYVSVDNVFEQNTVQLGRLDCTGMARRALSGVVVEAKSPPLSDTRVGAAFILLLLGAVPC